MALRSVSAPTTLANLGAGGGTLNAPAGYQAGDYLLALFSDDTPALDHANWTFTGWTFAGEILCGTDLQLVNVWWKIATGGDNFAVSTSTTGNSQTTAVVTAHTGRDNAAPTLVSSQLNTTTNSPISASLTGLTAVSGDDLVSWVCTDQTFQSSVWNFTQSTGFTEQVDYASSDWTCVQLQTKDGVSAGATGTVDTTISLTSGGDGTGWGGYVIALAASSSSSISEDESGWYPTQSQTSPTTVSIW